MADAVAHPAAVRRAALLDEEDTAVTNERAPATPEDFEVLREVETAWLADELSRSIANLGYPVGCGIAPNREHMTRAASSLFDRYLTMFRMVHEAANRAEPLP